MRRPSRKLPHGLCDITLKEAFDKHQQLKELSDYQNGSTRGTSTIDEQLRTSQPLSSTGLFSSLHSFLDKNELMHIGGRKVSNFAYDDNYSITLPSVYLIKFKHLHA